MLTRDERRALTFLAVVTVAGGVVRAARSAASGGSGSAAAAAVAPDLAGGDLVRQAALSREAAAAQRPLGAGERVDVERAGAAELERLPRVGKRLAQRIVADREVHGPFRSLAGLGRVPGVSAGLLQVLAPYLTFGGVLPLGTVFPAGAGRASPVASPAADSSAAVKAAACGPAVAVNQATASELMCLPGIGAVLAARIVAEREAHGAFRDLADLSRVQGLGPSRREKLRGHVTIP